MLELIEIISLLNLVRKNAAERVEILFDNSNGARHKYAIVLDDLTIYYQMSGATYVQGAMRAEHFVHTNDWSIRLSEDLHLSHQLLQGLVVIEQVGDSELMTNDLIALRLWL